MPSGKEWTMIRCLVLSFFMFSVCLFSIAQEKYSGTVLDASRRPLAGINLELYPTGERLKTDKEGGFSFTGPSEGKVRFSGVGFRSLVVHLPKGGVHQTVVLQDSIREIEEVAINSGYITLPKERSTGSYSVLSNTVLQRNNAVSLLDRMEGTVDGLVFDRRNAGVETAEQAPALRVRGLGTILSSTEPLIIVNGFPYDGELDDLNPDEVDNIVFLKDGAAASIWGARAGNGVIVITLKKGGEQRGLRFNFRSTYSLSGRPDLFYNRRFMDAAGLIDFEKRAFANGYTVEDPISPLSPVAELLFAEKNGHITAEVLERELYGLSVNDIRREAGDRLYRQSSVHQQHLRFEGGTAGGYRFSNALSYRKNLGELTGDSGQSLSFYSNNHFRLNGSLSADVNLIMGRETKINNGIGLYSHTAAGSNIFYPYSTLGTAGDYQAAKPAYRTSYVESLMEEGLLDWRYYPLEEVEINDDRTSARNLNLTAGLDYRILEGLKFGLSYNFQDYLGLRTRFLDRNSYYVRDLVNRFTQDDGTKIFPEGDILENFGTLTRSHTGRAQLVLDRAIGKRGLLTALGGMEIRESRYRSEPGSRLIGLEYDYLSANQSADYMNFYPTRPYGYQYRIEQLPNSLAEITDRFISYYLNANYRMLGRLDISGSARWDASNLFGVDFNRKGVPLWSAGIKYALVQDANRNLAARFTYGVSGNINKSASAVPTVTYGVNSELGLTTAALTNPGNADLRWEKTRITNLGFDFDLWGFLRGSLDGYVKNNVDLIGEPLLDPTSGISSYGGAYMDHLINYAGLKTYGMDMNINLRRNVSAVGWEGNFIFSYAVNRITAYNSNPPVSVLPYLDSFSPTPMEGYSRDVVYALPWNGLGAEDGFPIVYIDGNESRDYASYFNGLTHADLKVMGSSIPLFTGSYSSSIALPSKNCGMSFNISWKAAYKVRQSSIDYTQLYNNLLGHVDYQDRWQSAGDEKHTHIPAIPESPNTMMDNVYRYSDILVANGSHIRLNDVQLFYDFEWGGRRAGTARRLRLNLVLSNIGILWKSKGTLIDPDYPSAQYRPSRSLNISMNLNL